MNAVITALLAMVVAKLEEKDITLQSREILETIELELNEMSAKNWTIEDVEELNNRMDSKNDRLQTIKEDDDV